MSAPGLGVSDPELAVSEPGPGAGVAACPGCLARSWLLGRLSGHLDVARGRIETLLALSGEELIAAVAGAERAAVHAALEAFDPGAAAARCAAAGVEPICGCDPRFPPPLRSLRAAAPAVLHVAGAMERFLELAAAPSAAIVGARRASPYALETARSLARGVGLAGVSVVSGMALGVDAAAHAGALDAGAGTIAVLPAAPERPYPAAERALHRRILARGAAVSELGPGVPVRRWMFPARNRIIAALGTVTVVAAARRGSGALLTAALASGLRRPVGAVPGQVTAPLSWGPHELLRGGARLVAEPADILAMLRAGGGHPQAAPPPAAPPPSLGSELQPLLDAIADGYDPPLAFAQAGLGSEAGLAALAALELAGRIRRGPGGRLAVVN